MFIQVLCFGTTLCSWSILIFCTLVLYKSIKDIIDILLNTNVLLKTINIRLSNALSNTTSLSLPTRESSPPVNMSTSEPTLLYSFASNLKHGTENSVSNPSSSHDTFMEKIAYDASSHTES
jgi:hypothetical protein